MASLRRTGRTIIATGGVSTPGLERLKNGDILASYRRFRPDLGNGGGFSNWVGEVLRSTDGGRTWSDPIVEVRGRRPGIPETLVPYYGMAQLPDGTILLPSMGPTRGTYMMRSTDDGITWNGPEPAGQGIDRVDWAALAPYGKIRTLSDGVVIFPVCGQFRGHSNHVSAHLRSYDGGRTWTEFAVVASGHVFYNDAIELPDGRMIAIVVNQLSPAGHGMAPFYWTESHDLGRTWSEPDFTTGAIYGNSPALFLTKKGPCCAATGGPGMSIRVTSGSASASSATTERARVPGTQARSWCGSDGAYGPPIRAGPSQATPPSPTWTTSEFSAPTTCRLSAGAAPRPWTSRESTTSRRTSRTWFLQAFRKPWATMWKQFGSSGGGRGSPSPSYGSSKKGSEGWAGFGLVGSHRQLRKFPFCKSVMKGVWTTQRASLRYGM